METYNINDLIKRGNNDFVKEVKRLAEKELARRRRAEYIAGELYDLEEENKSLQDEIAGLKFARDTLNEEKRQLQNAVDVLKTKNHHLAAELYDRESRLSFIRVELAKISQDINKWK